MCVLFLTSVTYTEKLLFVCGSFGGPAGGGVESRIAGRTTTCCCSEWGAPPAPTLPNFAEIETPLIFPDPSYFISDFGFYRRFVARPETERTEHLTVMFLLRFRCWTRENHQNDEEPDLISHVRRLMVWLSRRIKVTALKSVEGLSSNRKFIKTWCLK